MRKIDLNKLTDVEVDGLDRNDYPDFCDAFLTYACFEDKELSDEELDFINENHPDFIHEFIFDHGLFI